MDTALLSELVEKLTGYLYGLDWAYIFTFIILGYGMNSPGVRKRIRYSTRLRCSRRYRIAVVGLCYGVALYFIRGYTLAMVEPLVQSFVFALVFHKLIIEWVVKRFFPSPSTSGARVQNENINKSHAE